MIRNNPDPTLDHAPMGALFVANVACDVLSRLTLFGAVLTLVVAHEAVSIATYVAAAATAATALRVWLRGRLSERAGRRAYGELLGAIAEKQVSELLANRDRERAASLVYEAAEVAETFSLVLPDIAASFTVLLVALVAVVWLLGPGPLLVGVVIAAVVIAALAPARRAARTVRERGWAAQARAERLVEALVHGAFELRASGRGEQVSAAAFERGGELHRATREAQALQGALAMLPAALTATLVVIPRATIEAFLGSNVGPLGVLGLVCVTVSLRAADAIDAYARSAPLRDAMARFLGRPIRWWQFAGPRSAQGPATPPEGSPIHRLEVATLSVRHGEGPATPYTLAFEAERGRGVALVGPNGAGKTTTLLACVGLIGFEGRVLIDGRSPDEASWGALRHRCLAIPQRPHIAPDESIAWHLGAYGTQTVDPVALRDGLERVGLWDRLEARARKRGGDVAAIPMGELSGGEQRRALLIRCLLEKRDVLLLDEPEAGLDAEGRVLLRSLLSALQDERILIVTAHDEQILPSELQRVRVAREPAKANRPSVEDVQDRSSAC